MDKEKKKRQDELIKGWLEDDRRLANEENRYRELRKNLFFEIRERFEELEEDKTEDGK